LEPAFGVCEGGLPDRLKGNTQPADWATAPPPAAYQCASSGGREEDLPKPLCIACCHNGPCALRLGLYIEASAQQMPAIQRDSYCVSHHFNTPQKFLL
jgi:hypothetical protein